MEGEMFSEKESECVDNCIKKVFGTERVLKAYIPQRMRQAGNLSMTELERRTNNPSDSYGPYFTAIWAIGP